MSAHGPLPSALPAVCYVYNCSSLAGRSNNILRCLGRVSYTLATACRQVCSQPRAPLLCTPLPVARLQTARTLAAHKRHVRQSCAMPNHAYRCRHAVLPKHIALGGGDVHSKSWLIRIYYILLLGGEEYIISATTAALRDAVGRRLVREMWRCAVLYVRNAIHRHAYRAGACL